MCATGPMAGVTEQVIRHFSWHQQFFHFDVKPVDPWLVLAHARVHLANGLMTAGDVHAYVDLGELQDVLLKEEPQCEEK